MPDGSFDRNESRNTPRFVPKESLSIFLASDRASLVHGDVEDLSEVGARVLTREVLDRGEAVTVDVRSGYTYLFRAEARIVWRTELESRRDSRVSVHGIFFTALSPFSRKLIRRLAGLVSDEEGSPMGSGAETAKEDAGAESDGDLQALFPKPGSRKDVFDLLSDPVLEGPLFDEAAESRGYVADGSELSGNLGYFNNTDVLQMLESARATGVLYVEGERTGQIHLRNGRICGCFSRGLDGYEAMFRLIVADRGSFRFVPSGVRTNLLTGRTTTQLLLEAHLRLDDER
jgi:hypothetical protein